MRYVSLTDPRRLPHSRFPSQQTAGLGNRAALDRCASVIRSERPCRRNRPRQGGPRQSLLRDQRNSGHDAVMDGLHVADSPARDAGGIQLSLDDSNLRGIDRRQ